MCDLNYIRFLCTLMSLFMPWVVWTILFRCFHQVFCPILHSSQLSIWFFKNWISIMWSEKSILFRYQIVSFFFRILSFSTVVYTERNIFHFKSMFIHGFLVLYILMISSTSLSSCRRPIFYLENTILVISSKITTEKLPWVLTVERKLMLKWVILFFVHQHEGR